jgi:hypothetical protein
LGRDVEPVAVGTVRRGVLVRTLGDTGGGLERSRRLGGCRGAGGETAQSDESERDEGTHERVNGKYET